jgi:RNA polymerase sigma-70 factor, ECF subfamily
MAPMAVQREPLTPLIEAARAGDRSAFGELIRRHAAGLVTLLGRVLRDRDLALDLAQETFLRAHQHLERFDPARSFRTWIFAIGWNLALDQLRRKRRRGERVGLTFDAEGAGEAAGPETAEPADHREEAPEASLLREERREQVRRALDLLPPIHRAVLVLRDLEGLSYEEVAHVLGLRLGTAKSRINRARLEFRDAYLRLGMGEDG